MVASMISRLTASLIVLLLTVSLCCVEITIVSTATGRPFSYTTETCDLPSGRNHGSVPSFRRSASARVRRCASVIGSGIKLIGFVAGKAEHHSLVAGSAGIDAHRDVLRLLVDRRHHRAGVCVETVSGFGIPNPRNRLAHECREVHVRLGRDLSEDRRQAGGHHRLACHARCGIFCEQRVDDCIGDLVGYLVRMAFGDGFGREEMATQHGWAGLEEGVAVERSDQC